MEYLIIFFLLALSAVFSGLTLGFFSLNKDDLKRKAHLGDKDAKAIYKLRKGSNLLLCTLLIGNVAVNSALSIFLGSLTSGFLAGVIATVLIVIVGEIAPQAVFSRYAMTLGAKLVWLVNIFRLVLYPVCWPMAKILDKALGEEFPVVYTKYELMKIIEEHEDSDASEIDEDEERIVKGALSFSEKKVSQIMTPRTEMYCLPFDTPLNDETIAKIGATGHSRIPIYRKNRDEIAGLLYVKDLLRNNWKDKTVGEVARKDVIFVETDKKLDELLDSFRKTRHHLYIVLEKFGGVAGIVTIEDVIEEIIGAEIVDEFDKYADLQEVARNKLKKKGIHTI